MNNTQQRFAVGDRVLVKVTDTLSLVKATVVGFIVKFDEPIDVNYYYEPFLYGKTVHHVKEFYDIDIVIHK